MTFRRTILALCVAMVVGLAVAALSQRSLGGGGAPPSPPSDTAKASVSPPSAALPAASEGAQRLDAVRTVKLFCDLVGSRRLWPAATLLSTPHVWSRRELRAVRRLEFRAARVRAAPDAHTLVVVTQVHAAGGSRSPVHDDDTTLFFTLGRVGTAAGGWLITAVATSP